MKNTHTCERSEKHAFAYCEEAAKSSQIDAIFYLGVFYEKGIGVAKDPAKAISLYQQAEERNYAQAFYELARCYREGIAVEADPAKALSFLEKAADANYPKGVFDLAVAYDKGDGVDKDLAKALTLYKKAVQLGELSGATALVRLDKEGEQVFVSPSERTFYERVCAKPIPMKPVSNSLVFILPKSMI